MDRCVKLNDNATKYYDDSLDKWGKPQTYKGVKLYPIKLKNEKIYKRLLSLLAIPKNSYKDRDIIKASYLNFIFLILPHMTDENGNLVFEDIYDNFIEVFEHVTQQQCSVEYKAIVEKPEKITDFKYYMTIGETRFTSNDFDNIREIVLEQNALPIEYVNEYIKELEDRMSMTQKGKQGATFEEELFSFCSEMKILIDELEDRYTFYQFRKHFSRVELIVEYELFKPLESSGQIKLKNGTIKHWLETIPRRGRYDSILIRKSDFEKDNDVMKVSKQV